MNTIKITALLLAGLLSGCVVGPERVATKSDKDLCQGYSLFRNGGATQSADNFKAEMLRRGLVKDADFDLIDQRKFKIGQSTCHLYASWGRPRRENVSGNSSGKRIQHVYSTRIYVYSRDGVISSYQQ